MNIKKYKLQYQLVLGLMIVLLLASAVIVITNLRRIQNDSTVISQLGIQKTLSQQISKNALMMEDSQSSDAYNQAQKYLQKNIKQWEAGHFRLTHGDEDQNATHFSEANKKYFDDIAPHFLKMVDAGKKLAESPYSTDSTARADIVANTKIIIAHNKKYLDLQYKINKQYTDDSAKGFMILRWSVYITATLLIITLLVAIFLFIKPMLNKLLKNYEEVQKSNEKLEIAEANHLKSIENQKKINQSLFQVQDDMERKNQELLESKTKIQNINQSLFKVQEDMERKAHQLMESEAALIKTTQELEASRAELEEKSTAMSNLLVELKTLQNQIVMAQEMDAQSGSTHGYQQQASAPIQLVENVESETYVEETPLDLEDGFEQRLIDKGLPVLDNEKDRVKILYQYGILDTKADHLLDQITYLATVVTGMPKAAITFIDKERQWYKSSIGLSDISEIPREDCFCQYTIMDDKIFEVPDADADPRFAYNTYVTGPTEIKYYAGAPLTTEEGFQIGTLLVVDDKPNQLSDAQKTALYNLASIVMVRLESRRQKKLLLSVNTQVERSFKKLKETEVKTAALINNTDSLIFSIDQNYILTAANDATLDYFREESLDIKVGQTDIRPFIDRSTLQHEEAFQRALSGERFTETTATKDQQLNDIWVKTSYNPILDEDQNVTGVSVFLRNVTAQMLEEIQKEEISQLNKLHNEAITTLTKHNFVQVSDANEAYKIINEQAAIGLKAGRCGIWMIDEAQELLEPKDLYDKTSQSHQSVDPISNDKYHDYYEATLSGKYLAVEDVNIDPITIQLADHYFSQNRVMSILNAPIRVNGNIVGIISVENLSKARDWKLEEVNFLQTITSFVTLSLEALERKKVQIQLEQSYEEQRAINEDMVITRNELAKKNEELNLSQVELKRIVSEQLELNEKLMKAEKEITNALQQEQNSKEQLKEAQSQLVHNEKMASLGQLTAGIAHEINNPINFVYNGIDTLKISFNELMEILDKYQELDTSSSFPDTSKIILDVKELKQDLQYDELINDIKLLVADIRTGAVRTMEIVKGLRVFSRLDEEEMKEASVLDCLDSTLVLLNNKIKNKITVNKYYDYSIPSITCYPGQLNQVFMNIMCNAVQAINKAREEGGQIDIYTEDLQESVVIRIKDNGGGMTESIKRRIFEPFFTTKDVGVGTGLGLSISYGIIEKHDGQIYVNSEEGKGSEFVIRLPKNLTKS